MKLLENPMFHDKSKNIEIKYYFIWDMVRSGAVKLQYVATDEQIADVLTKPLAKVKFEYFRERLGVIQIRVPRKRECNLLHGGKHRLFSDVINLGMLPC